jgi:hypothetical protein
VVKLSVEALKIKQCCNESIEVMWYCDANVYWRLVKVETFYDESDAGEPKVCVGAFKVEQNGDGNVEIMWQRDENLC